MEWLLNAAEAGSADAQYEVADLYDCGNGVERDFSKSFEWFLKAANQGHLISQFNIGIAYANGEGIEKDLSKSFEWFLKVAQNGCVISQYKIGKAYWKGIGVEKDFTKAIEWYLKSANGGYSLAQRFIGSRYLKGQGVEQDNSESFKWHLKAAEQGIRASQLAIASFYDRGICVDQDYAMAFKWYKKSAKNGNANAQHKVGRAYELGKGVEKSIVRSIYWFSRRYNVSLRDFTIFEYHYSGFAITELVPNNDDLSNIEINGEVDSENEVIIRFKEKDFNLSRKYLKKSKYLATMMSSNWKDFNQMENNQIILDLRSIQHEIFQNQDTDTVQIFEKYFNYLICDNLANIDPEMKVKLIELARYLNDDYSILQIIKESSILMRLYILSKFEMLNPTHIAMASCFLMDREFTYEDLSENMIRFFFSEFNDISSLAKIAILNQYLKTFNKYPTNVIFNESIFHVKLSYKEASTININNQNVTFTLKEKKLDGAWIVQIVCSQHIGILTGHQIFLNLSIRNDEHNLACCLGGLSSIMTTNILYQFRMLQKDIKLIQLIIFDEASYWNKTNNN